jgi:hypothetical protein
MTLVKNYLNLSLALSLKPIPLTRLVLYLPKEEVVLDSLCQPLSLYLPEEKAVLDSLCQPLSLFICFGVDSLKPERKEINI